jgi:hypothetical protein
MDFEPSKVDSPESFIEFVKFLDLPAPPVTPDTIGGVWEALSSDDAPVVFRLELDGSHGWLAVVAVSDPMIFSLTDTRWNESGVELHFKGAGGPNDPTPYTGVLRLHGVVRKAPEFHHESGLLTGEFVYSPELPNPANMARSWWSQWKLRFLKHTTFPYLDTVCKLSRQAREAIEQQRRKSE